MPNPNFKIRPIKQIVVFIHVYLTDNVDFVTVLSSGNNLVAPWWVDQINDLPHYISTWPPLIESKWGEIC